MYDFMYSLEPNHGIILNISNDGKTENLELLHTMKLIFDHPKVERYGWNIRADDLRLRHRGIHPTDESLKFDGMKAVAFLDSRLSKGLETGVKMFTTYPNYWAELNRGLKRHKLKKHEMAMLKFLEPDVYLRYAAGDAVAHREACLNMAAAFPENMKELYYGCYLPLTNYFTDMEFTGIPIDIECLEDMTKKYMTMYETKKQLLLEDLKETWGIEDFNPNSAPQKKKLLFDTFNCTPAFYTKSGKSPKSRAWYMKELEKNEARPEIKRKDMSVYQPSTNVKSLTSVMFDLEQVINGGEGDAEYIQTLQAVYHSVKLLVEVSRVGVFATKFLSKRGLKDPSLPDDEDEDDETSDDGEPPLKQSYWAATCADGKIHASFFECLKNFRASSSPNVQNPASKVLAHIPDIFVPGYAKLSKDEQKAVKDVIPANLRNIFYSGGGDFHWMECDVAGADLAIAAFISGDEKFKADFLSGSFHLKKCREYFQDDTLTKHDVAKYTIAKGITFRVTYTAGLIHAAMPIQADIYAESGQLIPIERLEYALNTWKNYERYMQYRDECTREVDEYRRITNARGCVLQYEDTDNSAIIAGWKNEALAFPIASELAWMMWEALNGVKDIMKKEKLWLKYIFPTNTVHDAGYWLVHKDLIKDNYIPEVIKYVFCHKTKIVTGDNLGLEMEILDRWKGKEKIFSKETKWNFETKRWDWKD